MDVLCQSRAVASIKDTGVRSSCFWGFGGFNDVAEFTFNSDTLSGNVEIFQTAS